MATAARSYHHGNLRAALLEGAERMLAERGVDGLSLRELAREVGVSHAAPRRHFPDKQALLDALATQGFTDLRERLSAAAAGEDFAARFRALARTWVAFATEHAALLELMFARKHRPDAVALREAADATFAVPLEVLSAGIAAGELDGEDPERTATLVFATLQGLAGLVNATLVEPGDVDATVDGVVELLLRGLTPR